MQTCPQAQTRVFWADRRSIFPNPHAKHICEAKRESPEFEPSQSEGVYHVTVDGRPVICLSDSDADAVLPLNDSQRGTHLLCTLDPERLERFKKALGLG
jgi:hypothetical protein